MFSRSFSFTVKVSALLVVIAVGLLCGPAGFGPAEQSAEAALLSEVRKLLASDAEAEDFFGQSVAISGDTAVVGAWSEDAGGVDAGAVYVFERDEGGANNWGEVKKLTASDAQAGDFFGAHLAVSGDTAVVTAVGEDAGGTDAGAAYVFQRDQGGANNWGEVKKLTASDAQATDKFGRSVAVSGDTAFVGAPQNHSDGTGAAYVFQRDEGGAGNWGEVNKLTASDAQAGDALGTSVTVSGNTAIVGAHLADVGDNHEAGAAYVFGRDESGAGNWGEVKKLTASDPQENDLFGVSVEISGDTAVVGSINEDAAANNAGAAYVFRRDEGGAGNWGEVKKLTASDAQAFDRFGMSVALSGNTAVVGAYWQDAVANNAGAAYLFGRDEGGAGNWGELNKLTASDAEAGDQFGRYVALSGDTAVVGANREDAGGSNAGAAYVFHIGPVVDSDGDGVPNHHDACPGTAAGATVDANGCSDAQADGDGDGVPDTDDACPGTAAGATVDANGCSDAQADGDGDGVSDAGDACPATAAGATVDANGCSDAQVDGDGDGICDAGAPSAGPSGCTGSDSCPAEDSSGFDADNDGCIDSIDSLGDFIETLAAEGAVDSTMLNSLHSKIDNAVASATRDNPCAAVSQLDAMKNEIEGQTGKKVSEDAAPLLLQYITNAQNFILAGIAPETC